MNLSPQFSINEEYSNHTSYLITYITCLTYFYIGALFNIQQIVKDLENEKSKLIQQSVIYEKLSEIFGPKGIQHFVFIGVILQLEDIANSYLSILSDGNYSFYIIYISIFSFSLSLVKVDYFVYALYYVQLPYYIVCLVSQIFSMHLLTFLFFYVILNFNRWYSVITTE